MDEITKEQNIFSLHIVNLDGLTIAWLIRDLWFLWMLRTPFKLQCWQDTESDEIFGSSDEPECTYAEVPRSAACDYCNQYRGCSLYQGNRDN